ncbi:hypothetical protein ACQUQU_18405 [Thalassolituus sp. LLYu03]|uniref:hypothetical protein n=1 Tax=Thalassolituus sp. LLYu03 TaxID=3421656 RepID=UPI003D2E5023
MRLKSLVLSMFCSAVKLRVLLTLLCGLLPALVMLPALTPEVQAASVIRVQPQRSDLDGSYRYYTDLLQKALDATAAEYGPSTIEASELRFSQARAFQALVDHQIDVFWAGTDPAREELVAPVRVPLYAGLLGYRVPVIRKADQARFDAIDTPEQLQAMLACQGDHWPDSDILQHNGYRVQRVTLFEVMYSMLQSGRCDYFPRGLNEVYAEVSHVARQDLMAYDRLILAYPFPNYFFVARDNPRLLERLTLGMERLVSSGELLAFLQQHPTTKSIFPLSRLSQSLVFPLSNPLLPPQTPLADQRLWLQLK